MKNKEQEQKHLDELSSRALLYAEGNGNVVYDWEICNLFHVGRTHATRIARNIKNVSSLPVIRKGWVGVTKIGE